jgi:hypothetical protein
MRNAQWESLEWLEATVERKKNVDKNSSTTDYKLTEIDADRSEISIWAPAGERSSEVRA